MNWLTVSLQNTNAVRSRQVESQTQKKDVYGEGEYKAKINLLDDGQIIEMADNLRGGVPMIRRSLTVLREADITELLEKNRSELTLVGGDSD